MRNFFLALRVKIINLFIILILFSSNSKAEENNIKYNSYDMGDEIWGAPAIDDLDNDGDYEIAITCKNNSFYIFDLSDRPSAL